ncbi:E1.1.1.30 [Mytilus coruscus]|uniref:E1.1.1.30 n=1 Tax=Mytilus coruscus TaxID=42192 RepID=A0A6J8BAK8_MYTCO|nr:E1.1.1.30 [Mytilus coruscus]
MVVSFFTYITGLGYHLAKRLANDGFVVYAGVLSLTEDGVVSLKDLKLSNLHEVELNVTKTEDIKEVTLKQHLLYEATEHTNFDEEEVIATLGKLVQKQALFGDLNEHILKLTEPEDVENKIIDSDEYSMNMETKIRHVRKFIQNIQTPQSRQIESSHTTLHTLNPETMPFVPTHNIANPHNAQSFETPSVQASHTFNTQQSTFSSASNHRLPKLTFPTFPGNI